MFDTYKPPIKKQSFSIRFEEEKAQIIAEISHKFKKTPTEILRSMIEDGIQQYKNKKGA